MSIDVKFYFCLLMTAVNLFAAWLVLWSAALTPLAPVFAFSAASFGVGALAYFMLPEVDE